MKLLNGALIKAFPPKARMFIGICLGVFILMAGATMMMYGGIWFKVSKGRGPYRPRMGALTEEARSIPWSAPGMPSIRFERVE